MSQIRKYSIFTLFLAGLSILTLILAHLALTDIYHGGEDLSSEWLLLKVAAFIFVIFILSTIFILTYILKIHQ